MRRAIDAHLLRDSRLIFVAGFNLPTFLQLTEWQTIRRIAVNLICRQEDEWGFRTKFSGGLEQIERAVGVHREISLRIARRPIVRRLRSRVDDSVTLPAMLFE